MDATTTTSSTNTSTNTSNSASGSSKIRNSNENNYDSDNDNDNDNDMNTIAATSAWWHPAAVHPNYCSTCGTSAQSLGKDKLNHCGRCKRAYYCSRDCQRHHWLGTRPNNNNNNRSNSNGSGDCEEKGKGDYPHKEYCPAVKYLQQDLTYLSTSLGLGIGVYAKKRKSRSKTKRKSSKHEIGTESTNASNDNIDNEDDENNDSDNDDNNKNNNNNNNNNNSDCQVSHDEARKRFYAVTELQRLAAPVHQLRSDANSHFESKQWQKAASAFEIAITASHNAWRDVWAILVHVKLGEEAFASAKECWVGNEGRMFSNMIWSYMQLPREQMEQQMMEQQMVKIKEQLQRQAEAEAEAEEEKERDKLNSSSSMKRRMNMRRRKKGNRRGKGNRKNANTSSGMTGSSRNISTYDGDDDGPCCRGKIQPSEDSPSPTTKNRNNNEQIQPKRIDFLNSSTILSLIKSQGHQSTISHLEKLYAKAIHAAERNPEEAWWKTFYRRAQVYYCCAQPHEAMKSIDRARLQAGLCTPFYDILEEKESALQKIQTLEDSIQMVLTVTDANVENEESDQDDKLNQNENKSYDSTSQEETNENKKHDRHSENGSNRGSNSSKNSTDKENDKGKLIGVCKYLSSGFTPLPIHHHRLPMSSLQEEMLAVRLIAATEIVECQKEYHDGTIETFDFRERAANILNKILSIVARAPLSMFPASGSEERIPPITVHLLAFYFRTCLSPTMMKELAIAEFCKEATDHLLSDDQAYAIAAHAFEEVESIHNPDNNNNNNSNRGSGGGGGGHAKTFNQTGQGGCMPCSFRLVRSGMDNWSEGLQMSVHKGKVDWTAFCLNRLLCRIDDGKHTVLKTILARDQHGCNAMMHAANDNFSGFSGLSIRMLVQATATSFVYNVNDSGTGSAYHNGRDGDDTWSGANDSDDDNQQLYPRSSVHSYQHTLQERTSAVRKVLNTSDLSGFTPAMACVSVVNMSGLAALVDLGARLWDKETNRKMPHHLQAAVRTLIKEKSLTSDTNTRNLFRAIQSATEEREYCSYCGKCPTATNGSNDDPILSSIRSNNSSGTCVPATTTTSTSSKLLYCSRCNRSRYCGKECQKLGYKKHKYVCSTAKVEEDVEWYASNISAPAP